MPTTHNTRHAVLAILLMLVSTSALIAQTGFSYQGPLPCLGATAFVNGGLLIDSPPVGAFTFEWTVVSPSGVTVTNTTNDPLGISFDEVGCWSVDLVVNGALVASEACGVEVFQDPTAAIDPLSVTGCVPFSPLINDGSLAGSGPISEWNWSIGFCPTITDQNINGQLCPLGVGTFDVQLSVVDVNGCFNTITVPDVVTISNAPPSASFSATSLFDCNVPVDIDFASTSQHTNGSLTHDWTIDGLSVGVSDSLAYTFSAVGVYEVCLTVVDSFGCADSFCRQVEIFDAPAVDFTVDPAVICAGSTVDFVNTSTPTPIPSVSWDLDGDGVVDATSGSPSFSYPAPGVYNAELLVAYSDNCRDSLIRTVTVDPPIEALFEIDTLEGCAIPFSIAITDLSTGGAPLTYDWSVTDQNGLTTPIVLTAGGYTFTNWGSYTLSLTLSNAAGCIDTFTYPEEVVIVEPRLEFFLSAPSNCVGDDIATVITWDQSLEPFVNWYYDIGCDGSIDQQVLGDTDGSTIFNFAAPGAYTICLTAESANGCSDTWQDDIIIAPAIFSTFTVSDTMPCGIDSVLFSADNPEPGLTYEWVYGDGTSSGLGPFETIEYSYCDTGYFDITLNVSNMGCFTTSTIDSLIRVPAPIADFQINTSCTDYYTVTLTNLSILPDTTEMIWTIDGDTLYGGEWEPTHTFATEGDHEITLWVDSDSTGCADFKRRTVKINEPTFDFSIGPTTGCPPVIVDITPLDTECVTRWRVDLSATDFLQAEASNTWDLDWEVNTDAVSINNVPTIDWPSVVYGALGSYDISMTIVDVNGCQIDTLMEDIINVDIDPFFAQFDSVVTRYCDSTVVCVTPELPALQSWNWSTNTGLVDADESTCFTFYPPYNQTVGTIITLSAQDLGGCGSTVSDTLFFDRAVSSCFSIDDVNPCKEQQVNLVADCSVCDSPPCLYEWDLDGDGLFDEAADSLASVSFSENGVYPIGLRVTDGLGCISESEQSVTVHTPEIAVAFSETIFACISTIVVENVTTGPGISTEWNITGFNDDGPITPFVSTTPSNAAQNAGINENTIGVYDLNITATNQYGCSSDSLISDFLGYGEAVGDFNCILETQDCAPFTIECEAFNPTDNTFEYTWNMGDNTPYSTTAIDHNYLTPGTYQVTLTMTDPANDCTFSLESTPFEVTLLEWMTTGDTTVCVGDSSLVEVIGLDSLEWISTAGAINQVSPTSWYLTPDGSTDFVAVGYQDGCLATQTLSMTNFALPTYVADPIPTYCLNEGPIALPPITPLGGDYQIDAQTVTALDSYALGAGNTSVDYVYTDTNNCLSDTTVMISINDTTTTTLTDRDICITLAEVDLSVMASDMPGAFTIDYGDGALVDSMIFVTDEIVGYPGVGSAYDITQTFTNAAGCTSTVTASVRVHPNPQVAFEAEDVCFGQALDLTNNSTVASGIIASQSWTFWTQGSSDEFEPDNIIADGSGLSPIQLLVRSDQNCITILSDEILIYDLPQLSLATPAPICLNSPEVALPTGTPAGGAYSIDGQSVQSIDAPLLGSGASALVYEYTDLNGCTDSTSVQVLINDTTTISMDLPEPCINGGLIDLVAVSSDGAGLFSFSYDGMTTQSGTTFTPTDILNYPGMASAYPITYTLIDANGCESTTTEELIVHPLPEAQFSASEACEGVEVDFDNTSTVSSGAIDSQLWTISGQGTSTVSEPQGVSYTTYGAYAVSLVVTTDQGCTATIEDSLRIHPYPIVIYSTTAACEDEALVVTNGSSIVEGAIDMSVYDWGDSSTLGSSSPTVTHIYTEPGDYMISITTTSDAGCAVQSDLEATIHPRPVAAMALADHCYGTLGVGTDSSTVSSGVIATVSYEVPIDNSIYDGPSFEHLFGAPGLAAVTHLVTSDEGCRDSTITQVRVHELPSPAFSLSDEAACTGAEITGVDMSIIPEPYSIDSVVWTINGSASSGDSVTFSFAEAIDLDIAMEVWSDVGCSASIVEEALLTIVPHPVSSFFISPEQLTAVENSAQFVDTSTDAIYWEYQVDDGTIYSTQVPTHEFSGIGEYEVLQIVENEIGCIDSSRQIVKVLPSLIVWVPTAITVDGDGLNERFYPVISGDEVDLYELSIYDRYGQLLFYTEQPSESWLGNADRGAYYTKDEVYNWVMKIKGRHGATEILQGTVTVIR